MPSRPLRRRWPLGLAGLLGFLLLASVVTAVVSSRRLEGSVPGRAAILGLAALPGGFLLGTSDGVLSSTDGVTWERVPGFEGETLVAGSGGTAAAAGSRGVSITTDLVSFRQVPADLGRPSALTVAPGGSLLVAQPEQLVVLQERGPVSTISLEDGPTGILSIAIREDGASRDRTILAGGLSSGLWRLEGEGGWQKILGTPIRAILMDPAHPERYLIGTAGGVLTAGPTAPEFTELRLGVEALAEFEGRYYAITADRLLYESADGLAWTVRTPSGE